MPKRSSNKDSSKQTGKRSVGRSSLRYWLPLCWVLYYGLRWETAKHLLIRLPRGRPMKPANQQLNFSSSPFRQRVICLTWLSAMIPAWRWTTVKASGFIPIISAKPTAILSGSKAPLRTAFPLTIPLRMRSPLNGWRNTALPSKFRLTGSGRLVADFLSSPIAAWR